tara:strand:+ start:3588 stop:4025 length:438 start_codon:yes stop_codon:yes gene_type:complete
MAEMKVTEYQKQILFHRLSELGMPEIRNLFHWKSEDWFDQAEKSLVTLEALIRNGIISTQFFNDATEEVLVELLEGNTWLVNLEGCDLVSGRQSMLRLVSRMKTMLERELYYPQNSFRDEKKGAAMLLRHIHIGEHDSRIEGDGD